jgi:hypothetical protein
MNVAVVGASDKVDRYSYKAVKLLQEKGHRVFPVHPRVKIIDGEAVYPTLDAIYEPIDTISLYVAADISTKIASSILQKAPKRVIFNPGAENDYLEQLVNEKDIIPVRACTLVLLRTGQF